MALQQEYFAIPPITRAYTTTCLLTTLAVVSVRRTSFCIDILSSSNWILSVLINYISIRI